MNWFYEVLPFSPLIVLVGFIALCAFLNRGRVWPEHRDNSAGLDNSMDWHRRNGSYRVMYTDTVMPSGKYAVSQPMSREVASDYAAINNRHGKIVAVVIDRDAPVPMANAQVN